MIPCPTLGTAPEAVLLLLRSEQLDTEYPIEEDFWVAAAEFADSAGADLINTSLGYTLFDDASQDHSYADMNGSSRISRAADMAFNKGMMVIVSAGNEGNKAWKYLSAPSDAVNAICVGASDYLGNMAGFSSRGPASDGRIKPDLISVGWNTWVQTTTGSYGYGSGTSFSAPVITGLTACLWQANPTLTNKQLRSCILQSCNQYNSPDTIRGYGIPDYKKAVQIAGSFIQWPLDRKDSISAGPNPFADQVEINWYDESSNHVEISIFNLSGKRLVKQESNLNPGPLKRLTIEKLDYLPAGLYLIQMDLGNKKINLKMLKQ
ncbi:MAG: S8 family serine peptidase [Bacteroidales bacterium]